MRDKIIQFEVDQQSRIYGLCESGEFYELKTDIKTRIVSWFHIANPPKKRA